MCYSIAPQMVLPPHVENLRHKIKHDQNPSKKLLAISHSIAHLEIIN